MERDEVFSRLKTSAEGLSEEKADRRRLESGLNVIAGVAHRGPIWRLFTAMRNPLVILLMTLAAISFATGDARAGTVMTLMVMLGVLLRFVQEGRADAAAEKLNAMIDVTATVVRSGQEIEVSLKQVVPGDLVMLSAGDMVPADVRLVSSKDLFIAQATLTGESMPVEKFDARLTTEGVAPLELPNICYLGTSVESGAASAVVLATGTHTYFGQMAKTMSAEPLPTNFDKGVQQFTWLMIRLMMVMVPLVFLINGFTKHNWHEAFFFSMAVAVGLTPEMLPMIVSACLSKGAVAMSKKKVIVKKLNAIQNFGAMDVLCTDKTGTLTMDQVILERHCDVLQRESSEVLRDAYLIAHHQTGLKNVLDRAVLSHHDAHKELIEGYRKIDEIPFDFVRRMMSVVVETPEKDHQLLTKGAPESIFSRCSFFDLDGETFPMEPVIVGDLMQQYQELSRDGFRVLAVAHKHLAGKMPISKEDEHDLVLKGYVAFLDPPKDSAGKAIAALCNHGVNIKVLTGDNELVTRKVCRGVGLDVGEILTGTQVESMNDAALAEAVERITIFARLSPADKQRVILALRKTGMSSASWETESMTRRHFMWPMSESPWIPASILPRPQRRSSSWKRILWCWTMG